MKRFITFLIAALATMAMVSSVAAAPSSYNTGFQVANLSSNEAAIVVSYVSQDGTTATTVNDTISANASKTYFPIDADAGFNGSVVISSNEPVAAIANVLGDGFAFGASYESFSGGAAEVNLPLIFANLSGFNTWFNVQNAAAPGGASVDVTVSYANSTCTETATIAAGAAATFDQSSNSCLGTGYLGAATITATGGNVVATVMQTSDATLLAYNGFTGGSLMPVMPLAAANNGGFYTGIQLQNTGDTSTNVTIDYAPSLAGSACQQTETIAPGASATFAINSPSSCLGLGASTFIGSAAVTANSASQPLVGIVNQLLYVGSTPSDKGSSYNAIDPATATGSVNFPLIMQNNSGFFTGFSVFNTGGSSADVTCTFSANTLAGQTFVPADVSETVASGAALATVQNTSSDSYVGSATCSGAGASLVGVANELLPGSGDTFFTYGGFNQ